LIICYNLDINKKMGFGLSKDIKTSISQALANMEANQNYSIDLSIFCLIKVEKILEIRESTISKKIESPETSDNLTSVIFLSIQMSASWERMHVRPSVAKNGN